MGAREAPVYGEAYGDGQGAAQEVKACESGQVKDGRMEEAACRCGVRGCVVP